MENIRHNSFDWEGKRETYIAGNHILLPLLMVKINV